MTPRERWQAVLAGKQPDRVPMDIWATPEVLTKLKGHFGTDNIWEVYRQLHIDKPLAVAPTYTGPSRPAGVDIYGCRHKTVAYATGAYAECDSHPLADCPDIAAVEREYTWPLADWFDYSKLPAQVVGKEEYPLAGGGSEPFLTYKNLRGDELAFMDLVERPELVSHCLGKLFDFRHEYTKRILEALPGQVTYCYVAEDLGAQESLMFSPRHIRKFFLPGMQRMVELAHAGGAGAFCHSDGAIFKIIPDLISIGIDLLNPIQWRCKGMGREDLTREFGAKVVLHGGVDNQQTMPFGTPAEVRAEVRDNLETLGGGRGYILAPCHNIQPLTPVENILALYAAGLEYGRL